MSLDEKFFFQQWMHITMWRNVGYYTFCIARRQHQVYTKLTQFSSLRILCTELVRATSSERFLNYTASYAC